MALLVSKDDEETMQKLRELVEVYNESTLGERSRYEIKEVGEDADGNIKIVLQLKT